MIVEMKLAITVGIQCIFKSKVISLLQGVIVSMISNCYSFGTQSLCFLTASKQDLETVHGFKIPSFLFGKFIFLLTGSFFCSKNVKKTACVGSSSLSPRK